MNIKEKIRNQNAQNLHTISLLQSQLDEAKEEVNKLNKTINEIKSDYQPQQQLSLNVGKTSKMPTKRIELSNNFISKSIEQQAAEVPFLK